MSDSTIKLDNIQGNIFGGFSKDHRVMLFLRFADHVKGRLWLKDMASNISTSEEVIAFNNLFKLIRKNKGIEGIVRATWTNIAFTYSGLKALKVPDFQLNQFPEAFKQGMAARAEIIGDKGNSAPECWIEQYADSSQPLHALLIIESDLESDLDASIPGTTLNAYVEKIANTNGAVEILWDQIGSTRFDQGKKQIGHEHFGFKDGVSQPGIRGIDTPNPDNPNQGNPGQDLLHPGEFVLGYPTQIGDEDKDVDGPNPNPGKISINGPNWSKDGSFLVFRRLRQDVKGFRDNVEKLSEEFGWSKELTGASLVGRYASGCPLERLKSQKVQDPDLYKPSSKDPGGDDPAAGNDDSVNNYFEYGDDVSGKIVPRAAHIRKAYPRDQKGTLASGTDSESRTQTHRLLRRGMPYGSSLGAEKGGEPEVDRGLLFLCYQRDIEDQFEFVQTKWINDPQFPCPEAKNIKDGNGNPIYPDGKDDDGEDPIIAQTESGEFNIPGLENGKGRRSVNHYVTTTGGDYFFSPSLEALQTVLSDPLIDNN